MDKDDNFIDPEEDEDTNMEEDDEEYLPPNLVKEKDVKAAAALNDSNNSDATEKMVELPLKPSNGSVNDSEQTVTNAHLKPDISELPKQSSRETLSYLKAKRITRHKNVNHSEAPDSKKIKTAEST